MCTKESAFLWKSINVTSLYSVTYFKKYASSVLNWQNILVTYANYTDTYFRDHINVNKYKFYIIYSTPKQRTHEYTIHIFKKSTQFMAQENNINLSC